MTITRESLHVFGEAAATPNRGGRPKVAEPRVPVSSRVTAAEYDRIAAAARERAFGGVDVTVDEPRQHGVSRRLQHFAGRAYPLGGFRITADVDDAAVAHGERGGAGQRRLHRAKVAVHEDEIGGGMRRLGVARRKRGGGGCESERGDFHGAGH